MRKWLKKRKVLVAVVALAAVGLTAFGLIRDTGATEGITTYTTEPAEMGTLSVTVSGSGNAYRDTIEVWPEISGEVATVEVSKGETVTGGDVLYTLVSDDLDDETSKLLTGYRQAEESYARSELSVMQAESGLDDVDTAADRAYASYLQALQSYERAELEADQARTSYDEALAGSRLPTPTATADAVAAAEKQLETAETGLDAARALRDNAWSDYQDAISESADDIAQQNLALAEAGLTSAASSLENARLLYDQAVADDDKLVVTAPHDGVVSALDIEVGDAVSTGGSASSSGESATSADTAAVSSAAPLMLTGNGPLAIDVEVNEVDVPDLEIGQKAEVIFDAMPELTFSGEVTGIDEGGTDTQGVVTFFVQIELHTDHDGLRTGMTGNATIVTAIAQDALLVPNAAVQTDDESGGEYVEVLASTTAEPRIVPVETGLYNATHTVIESGLDVGDPVVTATNVSDGEDESGSSAGISMPGMGGGRP